MSKKRKNKNNTQNNFLDSNEIKMFKDEFKRMIDGMSDEEFLDFLFSLMFLTDEIGNMEEMWDDDEGWEDEAQEFYKSSKNHNKKENKKEKLPF